MLTPLVSEGLRHGQTDDFRYNILQTVPQKGTVKSVKRDR